MEPPGRDFRGCCSSWLGMRSSDSNSSFNTVHLAVALFVSAQLNQGKAGMPQFSPHLRLIAVHYSK